jgi:two-component SAPR family response regulator
LTLVARVDVEAARAMLRTAADAYTGDFMEEDLYEDWAGPVREEARTLYISVLRARAELAERSGAVADAVRDHLRILDVDPWNEEAHVGLVRVMERAGRHGEARRYFEVYATRMEEIGLPAPPFPPTSHA